ncbi:MAG TPA: acyltransferase [Pseudomonas sp.]|jgi:peptidoglycan/LPS O-acetylase OafA/YrhL|nr:acyltransferase [Pseudomonas sp.]|tara:strand:- start:5166 stop:6332 length:1167 start_codon:yes stop_codon:yes gene_type:complete
MDCVRLSAAAFRLPRKTVPVTEPTERRKDNNFDFLRFLAALLVVTSHSFWLYGDPYPEMAMLGGTAIGTIAVYMFFIISGYLISASWLHSRSATDFVTKRLIRIFPALIVATLLTILLIGPLATELPLAEYFSTGRTWQYLSNLLLWIQFDLPGVFASNPFPSTINGSIWTLPFVMAMDLSLIALGLTGQFNRTVILMGFTTLTTVHLILLPQLGVLSQSVLNLFCLGMFFYAGVALYLYRQHVPLTWKIALPLLALMVSSANTALWPLMLGVGLPYLVIFAAHLDIPRLTRFGKYGDFSFGIYIFSFPLQQLMMLWIGPDQLSLGAFVALSYAASLVIGVISWHLIEKPALRLKRYLPQRKPAIAPSGENHKGVRRRSRWRTNKEVI